MPGFGSGPFGSGPFGSFDWSKQVLFRDYPEVDRRFDARDPGRPLETFADTIRPPFDELLRFARNFGSLRDADTVRTKFQDRINVELLLATATASGRTIEVLLNDPDPADPFVPLGATSVGWILEDRTGREFEVNSVHKLRARGPTIELAGAAVEPDTALNTAAELTGLVTFTPGSTTVTGVGTLFLTEAAAGQVIGPQGSTDFGIVDSVTNDFSLELEKPWDGSLEADVTAVAGAVTFGAAVLRPPAQVGLLGADFGIEVDQHEPEAFQRSSVRNVEQWLKLKGAQKSYDIIGKIAGYRVVAFGLWRVGSFERLAGTVEFTNGSTTVTGVGTAFLSEVSPGQLLTPGVGITFGTVATVTSDTSLELSAPYAGPSTGPGSPALVFDEPIPIGIPNSFLFEAPVGSGKLYTTQDPERPFFDEIAADVIPLDFFCFETPNWTTDPITPPDPPPPDGTTVEDAIGFDTQTLNILSTTSLGNGRWEVRVGPAVDLANIASIGFWYADFPTIPGVRHYLETQPDEPVAGEWTFEILVGTAPVFGGSVNISYQCRPAPDCGYCRASVIRVEVVPVEVLTDPDALLDGVLTRLVSKVGQVVPAHVRLTDLIHIVGPVQVFMNISVQVSGVVFVTGTASVGYYYDLVPADDIIVDPPNIQATGSVSSIP